ncbi:hypothetical protein ACROYT_G020707 [Oculina patagonica]
MTLGITDSDQEMANHLFLLWNGRTFPNDDIADSYGEWDYYYDYEPEEDGYDQPTEVEQNQTKSSRQRTRQETTMDHETADQTLGSVCTFSSHLLNKADFKEIPTADQLVGPMHIPDPDESLDGVEKEHFSSYSLADETADHISLAQNDLWKGKESPDWSVSYPCNWPEMSLTTEEAVSKAFPPKAETINQYVETTLARDIPPKYTKVAQFAERSTEEAQMPALETADKPGEPLKSDNFTTKETDAKSTMPQDADSGELTEIVITVPRPVVAKKQVTFAVFPPPKIDYELEVHTNEVTSRSAGEDVLQPDDQRYHSQSYHYDARFPLYVETEHVGDVRDGHQDNTTEPQKPIQTTGNPSQSCLLEKFLS